MNKESLVNRYIDLLNPPTHLRETLKVKVMRLSVKVIEFKIELLTGQIGGA